MNADGNLWWARPTLLGLFFLGGLCALCEICGSFIIGVHHRCCLWRIFDICGSKGFLRWHNYAVRAGKGLHEGFGAVWRVPCYGPPSPPGFVKAAAGQPSPGAGMHEARSNPQASSSVSIVAVYHIVRLPSNSCNYSISLPYSFCGEKPNFCLDGPPGALYDIY